MEEVNAGTNLLSIRRDDNRSGLVRQRLMQLWVMLTMHRKEKEESSTFPAMENGAYRRDERKKTS